MIDWPEIINAVGVAVTGVLGAWTARNSRKIKELSDRLAAVETERDGLKKQFRSAVLHIRDWLSWRLEHAPGVPPPPLPPELRAEV